MKNQCRYCGIIGTKERPVRYRVCSVCRELMKDYPKEVRCFICGKKMMMNFKEWSKRGNSCEECDDRIGRLAREHGYFTLPVNRKELIDYVNKLKDQTFLN